MSIVGLVRSGGYMVTRLMNIDTLLPKFDLKYLTTIGLLIYAVNGAVLVAPFVTQMRKTKTEFPKAMIT